MDHQDLRRRFATLTTAHLADACIRTRIPLQAHVRPELALAILERKFPERWSKSVVVAGVPAVNLNLGEMLTRVMERIRAAREAVEPPQTMVIEGRTTADGRPHDPRPPRPVLPAVEPTELTVPSAESVVTQEPARRQGLATLTPLGVPRLPA